MCAWRMIWKRNVIDFFSVLLMVALVSSGVAQTWVIEVADSDGSGHTSLELDGSGWPHISYLDVTNCDVKYAFLPARFVLIGELIGGRVQLTWAAVTEASEYWVYGTSNLQWFMPGMGPGYDFRIAVLPAGATIWSSPNGVGDPESNWTYLVMAVDATEQELARSNRVGEQDFETDIP